MTPHVYLTPEELSLAMGSRCDYGDCEPCTYLFRALADLKAREKEVRQLREALESIRSTADPYAHTGVIMPSIHRTADEALRSKGKGG